MLKKSIALAAVLTFLPALTVPAAEATTKQPVPMKAGTITKWDAATKKGVVKDTKDVETSFVWNEKTMLTGTPKVGEHAFVWYKQEKDGTVMATHISIGTRLAMQHAVRPADDKTHAQAQTQAPQPPK